ncbi:bifunctional nuclease family protein [Corynebacterium sp. zg-331]|uniref:bifunctional nuclease family protein n=1 Tax=unclassified Corynebacterium TaxID=2624378 RepID=UPI00128BA60C|nr:MULTISPECIES: bifunctional nuclease family protein [unclassified Corynebacterium]MBC3185599.1 bifunctional nuclease family protein [Corynebacterium sp. zg-331]MPV52093.1 bifunctional nuclease family protein [Corynebacterium sp. zg331]
MIPVEFRGVRAVGPEGFRCVVLRWEQRNRILPLWVSPLAAEALAEDSEPRRPSTADVLAEVVRVAGATEIGITSAFEGVFVATIVLDDGAEIDARPSDALLVARALELPFGVAEDVLTQFSFFAADDSLREYLNLSFGPTPDSVSLASRDAQADADFELMMRQLGVSEEDLSGGSDATGDDNGERDL